jgi:hypothetical protein
VALRLTVLALAGLVFAMAALAGCGGDDGADESPATEEFVAEVDEICTAAQDELQRAGAEIGTPRSEGAAARALVREAGPVLDGLVEDLSAVEPPAELEQGYGEFINVLGESTRLLQAEPVAALQSAAEQAGVGTVDQRHAEAADQLAAVQQRGLDLARELGLPEQCGSGPGGSG